MKKAVIYCRVSSTRQVKEGHGLSSQESNCRKYSSAHGFTVQKVFRDDYTGGGNFWKRPALTEMLRYLDQQQDDLAVIFDDLKRFARDTLFHLKLRQELSSRNAYPRCPTFRFEDTPEGNFVETIIAATGELERKQNRRQVISRMKARLEAGHWVFAAPLGYRNVTERGQKKVVLHPPECDFVKDALEGYACGKLSTQSDVERFLRGKRCCSKWSTDGTFTIKSVKRFLSNEFYCGWCVSPKWDIRARGQHEPLITEKTHRQIMDRLSPTATTFLRKNVREEFPLRGHICCAQCQKKLTAGWSRGRSAKYPYYICQTKGCLGSVRVETMEEQFLDRLQDATPTAGQLGLFESVLRETFGDQEKIRNEREKNDRLQVAQLEKEIDVLVDSVTRASTSSVRKIYEGKIDSLQAKKEQIEAHAGVVPDFSLEPVLDKSRELLRNPVKYWKNGSLHRRKVVQELAFKAPISYDENSAYRTAEFSLVYAIFEQSGRGDSRLVDLLGNSLNPVAEEFERWRKILKI